MPAACETQKIDGQYVFSRCTDTGAEGLWSGSEQGTLSDWAREHQLAHREAAHRAGLAAAARPSRGGRMQYGLRYS